MPTRSRSFRTIPGLVAVAAALTLMAVAAPASPQTPPVPPPGPPILPPAPATPSRGGPLAGQGIWIWQLGRSQGGSPTAIASRARAAGMGTVLVKSGDAITFWPQFSRFLVTQLQAAGVHVCAWQYVYGKHPGAEARLGARAVSLGAECLVIDAEKQYEGRYAQASQYVEALRRRVGAGFPIALASFPYVDRHPAFPYSAFLGPGGAQYNVPQVYWKAIGTSVDRAVAHTYAVNAVYDRPILPLGQLWMNPRPIEIERFCALAGSYGSAGVSWWSWQAASPRAWDAAAELCRLSTFPSPSQPAYPTLGSGAKGDVVVWVQQHLPGSRPPTGVFDTETERGVAALQAAAGLPATGVLDAATWRVVLRRPGMRVSWTAPGARPRAGRTGSVTAAAPRSSSLPAQGNELARRHG
jgi:peptidoglycan hydrolase-like protein with peptidoglycan-binding domain